MSRSSALDRALAVLRRNRSGQPVGVYSVCSAHPLALEAAMIQARQDQAPLLLEATANQVNQFGGYTGMRPADFPTLVARIAKRVELPGDQIVLGGDHLGPVCWSEEKAKVAMARARDLVESYVKAGFLKLHLDTSMPCGDDARPLGEEVIAMRAAELCEVAEEAARGGNGGVLPVYIVGTEVPTPGGAQVEIDNLKVTTAENAVRTAAMHKQAFAARGLSAAWPRVIGLVVQPGVEFDHASVQPYEPQQAEELSAALADLPGMVYEAHSTDYQTAESHRALVRDHFAILKVGPQLTFALREALFALSAIEQELLGGASCTRLPTVCEKVMQDDPGQWIKYYPRREPQASLHRRFSYSDRIRYYWNHPAVSNAVNRMFQNLSDVEIPLPLLSQHLPEQYNAVRYGGLAPSPRDLAIHKVMQVTSAYSRACRGVN